MRPYCIVNQVIIGNQQPDLVPRRALITLKKFFFQQAVQGLDIAVILGCGSMGELLVSIQAVQVLSDSQRYELTAVIVSNRYAF